MRSGIIGVNARRPRLNRCRGAVSGGCVVHAAVSTDPGNLGRSRSGGAPRAVNAHVAVAASPQKSGAEQRVENAYATRLIDAPEPARLRDRDAETWHLQKLSDDAGAERSLLASSQSVCEHRRLLIGF